MKVKEETIERPLDLLNNLKGKEVIVVLDDGKEISGKLLAFDININLVLKVGNKLKFVRGSNVRLVS